MSTADPISTANPSDPPTRYTYNALGDQLTETDPDGNITTYAYNGFDEVARRSQSLVCSQGASPTTAKTTYQYDADGNLLQEADADANADCRTGTGSVIVYAYNSMNQVVSETCYDTISQARSEAGATRRDHVQLRRRRRASPGRRSNFRLQVFLQQPRPQVTADNLGGTGTPNVPDVVLTSTYDADGDRKSLTTMIGGTADFVNSYQYDSSNREIQVTQSPAAGKTNVNPKTVQFAYYADGDVLSIDRFNALTASGNDVDKSFYIYDSFGRVVTLAQGNTRATSALNYANDTLTYYANGEVESFTDSTACCGADNISNYNYDKDGQLTGDTATNAVNRVANTYDPNGNPKTVLPTRGVPTATSVGTNGNTLLFDGANSYQYDADGNVILSWASTSAQAASSDTGAITSYGWDNRGRLVSVNTYASYAAYIAKGTPTQSITYTYEMFNNLIGRTVSGTGAGTQRYVFDGENMVLAFDGSGSLTDRYLCGPAVDQVLADEYLPSGSNGTLWTLGDYQNSVTDLVTDSGVWAEHLDYSPFGVQTPVFTNNLPTSYELPVGYTGAYTDPLTNLQLHGLRWYNPTAQRWMTTNRAGWTAGDSNLYRYCGNCPRTRPTQRDSAGDGVSV